MEGGAEVNPEQQRIAIAKACGWLQSRTCHWGGWWYLKKGKRAYQQTPPDYLNDLNAMHEAENTLDYEDEIRVYVDHVSNLNHAGNGAIRFHGRWACVNATAAQKAEAFLKTLNLWTP